MKKNLLLFIVFCTLIGCDPDKWANTAWYTLLENNSDEEVVFYINMKKISDKEYRFSTEWPNELNYIFSQNVPAHAKRSFEFFPYKYVKYSIEDSLSVFVFAKDTVEKYTLDELQSRRNYIKRYDDKFKNMRPVVYP